MQAGDEGRFPSFPPSPSPSPRASLPGRLHRAGDEALDKSFDKSAIKYVRKSPPSERRKLFKSPDKRGRVLSQFRELRVDIEQLRVDRREKSDRNSLTKHAWKKSPYVLSVSTVDYAIALLNSTVIRNRISFRRSIQFNKHSLVLWHPYNEFALLAGRER